MSEQTNIEWCDSTFNSWEGCTKVSPGCDHCYAEARNGRFHAGANWGPGAPRLIRSDAYWREPLKWERDALHFIHVHGRRRRVFCSSLADVFDNEAPAGQRERLWALIRATPNLNWLLLTKRIGNAARMLPEDWGDGYDNVWLGSSIVNQEEANRDIPKLLTTPAKIRFLSMEPLLGPVDLTRIIRTSAESEWAYCDNALTGFRASKAGGTFGPKVNQVIVGGESGLGARPMHPTWARSLRDQCTVAGVPFLFKQWGEWLPWLEFGRVGIDDAIEQTRYRTTIWQDDHWEDCGFPIWCDMQDNYGGGANGPNEPDQIMGRVSKKAAGRLLDGVTHDGFPESRL